MILVPSAGSLLVVCALAAVILPSGVGLANPLDDKSCEELGAEQEALKSLGVEGDMAKGHEWARANLAQSDLNIVRQFIDISERVKFRCAGVTTAKVEVKPDTAGAANQAGALNPAPPLPVRRTIASRKPATVNANAASPLRFKAAPAAAPSTRVKIQPQKPAKPQKAGES